MEQVVKHLARWGRERDILVLEESTATVDQAAQALGVVPGRIAKSISLRGRETPFVLVTAGDTKIDNAKFKARFGLKAKLLSPQEALEATGHAIGGVCPFGLPPEIPVYLDRSLQRFETVYPACGTGNSAIRLTAAQLEEYALSQGWVEVSKAI